MRFDAQEFMDIMDGRLKVTVEYEGKPPVVFSSETVSVTQSAELRYDSDVKPTPRGPGSWNRQGTDAAVNLALHIHLRSGLPVRASVDEACRFINDDLKLKGSERVAAPTVRRRVTQALKERGVAASDPEVSQAPDFGSS